MLRTLASLSLLLPLLSSTAHAGLQVFTDRDAWRAAAGGAPGDLFEDFASVASDRLYSTTTTQTVGFASFSVVDGFSDDSWRIDAAPATFSSLPSVDGSTFATVLGFGSSGNSFGDTRIAFAPVRAFGFDYSGASYSNDDGRLTTSLGDGIQLDRQASGVFFVGLLYDAGETFDSVVFDTATASTRFGTGIDNLEAFTAVPQSVPTPSPLALIALGALGWLRRGRG